MSEAFAKRLFAAREEALKEQYPESSIETWDALSPQSRSVWLVQARILLDTLADDDELMFRMGCIEYEAEPQSIRSESLKAATIGLARADALAFLRALREA